MPEAFANEATAAWISVVVTVLLAVMGFWSRDRRRDNLLKEMEIYKAWEDEGKDEALARLHQRIETGLDRLVKDPFVTPALVLQMSWAALLVFYGVACGVSGSLDRAVSFVSLGCLTVVVFLASRMLDEFISLENDAKHLAEWKRRKAEKREGRRKEQI